MSPTTPASPAAAGRRAPLAAAFLAFILGAVPLRGQTPADPPRATNALPAFEVKTLREGSEGFGLFHRVYVTIGTNKAAFLVPGGYRMQTDAQGWRIALTEPQGRSTITILFYAPQPATTPQPKPAVLQLKPETCLEILLRRHPNAKLIEQFTSTAAGMTGPAFELSLRNDVSPPQLSRAVFIPALASLVEFQLVGNADTFAESRTALNTLLLTFRVAENGKLEIAPISDKL